jgi:hypothetical protein
MIIKIDRDVIGLMQYNKFVWLKWVVIGCNKLICNELGYNTML